MVIHISQDQMYSPAAQHKQFCKSIIKYRASINFIWSLYLLGISLFCSNWASKQFLWKLSGYPEIIVIAFVLRGFESFLKNNLILLIRIIILDGFVIIWIYSLKSFSFLNTIPLWAWCPSSLIKTFSGNF